MAAMTSKFSFECVNQYYTDQCSKQRGHLSAHASEGQCVEHANREILAELKIEYQLM